MQSISRTRIASHLYRINPRRSLTAAVAKSNLASIPKPQPPILEQRPYFVPRNKRGNLPVYTDIRNAGGRHLVLVRNVEGNASVLARDLSESLLEREPYEASRLKVHILQSKHLVISGGRWKNDVVRWLQGQGF